MIPAADAPFLFCMTVEGWVMAASLTVLVYDYLCTFKQEVDYVWSSPWALGLPLFYLNRYLPFVDQVIILRLQLSVNSRQACLIQESVAICLLHIGYIISQTIIILRTIAFWGTNRRIGYALGFVAICSWIIAISTVAVLVVSMEFSPLDFPARGCPIRRASDEIYGLYITIFLVELLIVILTAIKALSHVKQSRSSWVKQLYRDGLFFCICMLCITFINIVVPRISLPLYLKGIFSPPQRALHSIFCNRVVLQILKYRAESPPPLTPNNHGPRSRSAYAKTLEILTSLQPITFFTTTDEVEMDSASILEREGWIG